METVLLIVQVVLALGLLNVWCFRCKKSTAFRGSDAKSLKQEFKAYGLPEPVFYIVGFLKISCALLFILAIWFPQILIYPAGVLSILMLGALAMHIKVKDPIVKSIPAFTMLVLSSFIIINVI